MIQRIQTVYLLLCVLALVICLYLPIASISGSALMYNLATISAQHTTLTANYELFILLAFAVICDLVAIFTFKRRRMQMKLCVLANIFSIAWYVVTAIELFRIEGKVSLHFAFILPLVAIILQILARKGIKHDDDLVRSADRIR